MVTDDRSPPEWAIRSKADRLALERKCYWDDEAGLRVVKFAHAFYRPQYIKGKFRLLEWQQRFLRSLYSWRNANGSRRFQTANLHIGKKNGP